jgi:chromosome partitioning protein
MPGSQIPLKGRPRVKTIAITNQKGGVGKTTTAVNLSAGLAARGCRILLADVDPQGNATSAMGMADPGARSLYHALIGECAAPGLVRPTSHTNLDLIPANLAMAGAEIEVARMDEHLLQLRRALEPLSRQNAHDFLFLDCPPSLGIWMSNALAAADEVLIPIQCEYYSLEGLSLLMQVMEEVRRAGVNPGLGICGLVMTMFDSRTNLNPAVVEEVRRHFGNVVFDVQIPRTVRLGEAPSHGRTIFDHDPHGAGARAYAALADEFLDRQQRGIAFVWPSNHE